ncbi:MAG: hypothetical protein WBA45_08275 [Microthrixaceae bacterium]
MSEQLDLDGLTPGNAIRIATSNWLEAEEFTSSTLERMSEVADRFARRVAHRSSIDGVSAGDCDGFIFAATRDGTEPSIATLHFRRTTLRAIYRSLRYLDILGSDPTLDIQLPPRSSLTTRALADDEIKLLRLCALGRRRAPLRAAVALALAEATATTREIPLIHCADIDLDSGSAVVKLPGAARVDPRDGHLTPWGTSVIRRWFDEPGSGEHLVPTKGPAGKLPAQAGTCNLFGFLLQSAGLRGEADVRPGSIRAWAGASIHRDTGRIDEVARRLGVRSLDAAADVIGFDWKSQR